MTNRSPTLTLAGFLLSRTDKQALAYNTLGFVYANVGDDYYYFKRGAVTLANAISPAICAVGSPCTIPISGSLGASCPLGQGPCALRIGGTDIVVVSSYTGTTLTSTRGFILNSDSSGATIEAAYVGHQSVGTMPPASRMYYYAANFPAMNYDFGVPDAANGFNYPCSGSYLDNKAPAVSGTPPCGCWWQSGAAV